MIVFIINIIEIIICQTDLTLAWVNAEIIVLFDIVEFRFFLNGLEEEYPKESLESFNLFLLKLNFGAKI